MLRLTLPDHAEDIVTGAHGLDHRIAHQGVVKTIGQGSFTLFQQGVAFLCCLEHLLQRFGAVSIVFLLTQCLTRLINRRRIGIHR